MPKKRKITFLRWKWRNGPSDPPRRNLRGECFAPLIWPFILLLIQWPAPVGRRRGCSALSFPQMFGTLLCCFLCGETTERSSRWKWIWSSVIKTSMLRSSCPFCHKKSNGVFLRDPSQRDSSAEKRSFVFIRWLNWFFDSQQLVEIMTSQKLSLPQKGNLVRHGNLQTDRAHSKIFDEKCFAVTLSKAFFDANECRKNEKLLFCVGS